MNLLKQFFTTQYLFNVNSAFISPKEKLFFLVGAILVLLGVVLKISSVLSPNPIDKKYRQKFYLLFLTVGLLELFWYLCRYENVRFFNTHFVAWIYILIGIIWFVVILVKAFRNYSREKMLWEKDQVKLKYLPGYQSLSKNKKREPRSFEDMQLENEARQARTIGSARGGKI